MPIYPIIEMTQEEWDTIPLGYKGIVQGEYRALKFYPPEDRKLFLKVKIIESTNA